MKAAIRVLDSYSLIAYFDGEEGAEKMVEILRSARDSGRPLLLSVINWGEVYYITMRESGRERAEELGREAERIRSQTRVPLSRPCGVRRHLARRLVSLGLYLDPQARLPEGKPSKYVTRGGRTRLASR